MKIAIVGATGLVGSVLLSIMEERKFPVSELILAASKKSVGKKILFKGNELSVVDVQAALNLKPHIAIFSAGSEASLNWAPKFASIGATVIDNSSAWRMDSNKKLIVPTNVFKNFKVNFSNKNFIDYGILLKQNTFVTKNNHCILPNNLAFTYALAIAQIGKAKQIYLAGFDGYDQNVDKLLEMDKTINLFKRKFTNRNLISITPTKYNFLKKSIHAY